MRSHERRTVRVQRLRRVLVQRLRRGGLLAAVLAILLLPAPTAGAHAVLIAAEPAGGSTVDTSPGSVTLTFTEEPDPALSTVDVVDAAGVERHTGSVDPDPGDSRVLRVPLAPGLPEGTYTVSWRVVSRVDGHLTAGSFAFGVGVTPDEVDDPDEVAAMPLSTAVGRMLWYAGLSLVVGAAWMGLAAFDQMPRRVMRMLPAGCVLAAAGLVVMALGQRAQVGGSVLQLVGTSIGRSWLWRVTPLLAAAFGVVLTAVPRKAAVRVGLGLAAAGAAGAMLAHVAFGHAAAGPNPVVASGVQWAHFLAAAVWLGGLAALVTGLRGLDAGSAARAARRFSTVAVFAIGVLAVTGVSRAVSEVGSIQNLTATSFGRMVIAKAVLLAGIGVLGAANRYRNLPLVSAAPSKLRKVGTFEVVLAAAALAVAGVLAGTPPASYAEPADEPVVAEGSDFATSVQATLEVDPGFPGTNTFTVHVADYDTGTPIDADDVRLRFAFGLRPDMASTTLLLQREGSGVYSGRGANLSLSGRWNVEVAIRDGVDTTVVPLEVTTRIRRPAEVIAMPDQPTLYVADLGEGRTAQLYLDPDEPGPNDVHVTLFDQGAELPLADVIFVAIPPEGAAVRLEARRFGPGHFIAEGELGGDGWRIDVNATTEQGEPVSLQVEIEMP